MKRGNFKFSSKRICSTIILMALILNMFGVLPIKADTLPYEGDAALGQNQPRMLGHSFENLRDWHPSTDPFADTMRARVPLRRRISPNSLTQANPDLAYGPEVLYMAGDYGNSFNQGTHYTNKFGENILSFWQYIDYYASWHGVATAGTPLGIWSTEHTLNGDWRNTRNFDFGSINMPNPAYTNAAHKNGVLSIGCVYFDPNNRPGQPAELMLEKDDQGNYIMAKKLIEFANWYGFDGYFFNYEESITSWTNGSSKETVNELKTVMKQVADAGLYCQQYDSLKNSGSIDAWGSVFDDDDYSFIHDDKLGDILDSIFISYDWSANNKIEKSKDTYIKHNMSKEEIYQKVFYGVEAAMGKMEAKRHNSTYNFPDLYTNKETKELLGSIALFTPDDFIHNQIKDSLTIDTGNELNNAKSEYQWMAAERERLYFSGANSDPTRTGKIASASRADLGLKDTSGWVGVADFTTERSVIDSSVFYSNFNTGHGLEYRIEGKVSSSEEWANINIQDIMPTWQWWIDTNGTKINVDFDYGPQHIKHSPDNTLLDSPYTQIGAYKGGSSLAIFGDLNADNRLHLFKTDLSVKDNSKASVTFMKTSKDSAKMNLVLTLNNEPQPITLPIADSANQSGSWVTTEIDLSEYSGKSIAAIDLSFTGTSDDYQMNIGEIKVLDGVNYTPDAPSNVRIDKAFDTGEIFVTWEMEAYDKVIQYNIYTVYEDGSREFVGGIYDDIFYIKNTRDDLTGIEVCAVGQDGSESTSGGIPYSFAQQVRGITVKEAYTPKMDVLLPNNNGFFKQTAEREMIDVSWTAPQIKAFDSYWLEVSINHTAPKKVYTQIAAKEDTSAQISVPHFDGEEYTLKIYTVRNGIKGDPISYTGYMKDEYSAPFDAGYTLIESWAGEKLMLHPPKNNDWYRIDVNIDGKPARMQNKYSVSGEAFRGLRGVVMLNSISLPENSKLVEITLTDYSGNVSSATYYPLNGGPKSSLAETTAVYNLADSMKDHENNAITVKVALDGDIVLRVEHFDSEEALSGELKKDSEYTLTDGATETADYLISPDLLRSLPTGQGSIRFAMASDQTHVFTLEVVDTTKLEAAFTEAADLLSTDNGSLEELKKAYDTAKAVLDNSNRTVPAVGNTSVNQEKVESALGDLKAAIEAHQSPDGDTDKSRLKQLLDLAATMKDSYKPNLVEAVKVKFEATLLNANSIYDHEEATQEEIDGATKELSVMITKLNFTADNVGLKEAIDYANTVIASGDYEDDANMKAYRELVTRASEIYDDPNATETDQANIITELLNAEEKLNAPTPYDTKNLQAEVSASEATLADIENDLYLEMGQAEFKTALEAAKNILSAPGSQEEIDQAYSTLYDARQKLELAPDKTALGSLLDKARQIKADTYTTESIEALNDAINSATSVYDDPQANKAQVTDATAELEAALSQLVVVTPKEPDSKEQPTTKPTVPATEAESTDHTKSTTGTVDASTSTTAANAKTDTSATNTVSSSNATPTGDTAFPALIMAVALIACMLAGVLLIMKKKKGFRD